MSALIHRRDALVGITALAVAACSPEVAGETILVAAAADLQFAVAELAAAFEGETSKIVQVSLGSTGNFARQIRAGAPFHLFLAADEQFIFDLARDGFTRDQGALYALGRIVLQVPHGSELTADGSLESLRMALQKGKIRRFAIANPEHAPYGKRAEEALKHAGLWEPIQPYLVLGENVAQAAQFALSGNAEGGIIAYSMALAPDVARRGTHDLIPNAWHQPLRQRMALLRSAGSASQDFYNYIQSPGARSIMERYGFILPKA